MESTVESKKPTMEELRKRKAEALRKKAKLQEQEAKENEINKEKQLEFSKLKNLEEEKVKAHHKEYSIVSEAEYKKFENTGEVSDFRLEQIAEKIKNNAENPENAVPLDPMENAIFVKKTGEINKIIAEKWPAPSNPPEPKPDDEKALEEKTEEIKNEINQKANKKEEVEILNQFKNDFGLEEKDLPAGFADTDISQQKLALQNLEQIKYKLAKEGGAQKFQQELANTKLFGQKWGSFIPKFFKSFSQSAKTKQYEKQSLIENETHKETYANALKQISEGFKKVGVASEIGPNGLNLKFISQERHPIPESVMTNLNAAATEFSKIPAEWGYWEGTMHDKMTWMNKDGAERKAQYQKFIEAKTKYEEAMKEAELARISGLENEHMLEEQVVIEVASMKRDVDTKVKFLQQLQANPDAERLLSEISQIKNQTKWEKLTGWTKGIKASMLIGIGSRKLLTNYAGYSAMAVGPAVAAILGGFRGWRNAERDIISRQKLAREGKSETKKELGTFVKADHEIEKLKLTIDEITNPAKLEAHKQKLSEKINNIMRNQAQGLYDNDPKAKKLDNIQLAAYQKSFKEAENGTYIKQKRDLLRVRMNYIMGKIDAGRMSYGEKNNILQKAELYALVEEAGMHVLTTTPLKYGDINGSIESTIEGKLKIVMGMAAKEAKNAKTIFNLKKIATGAVMGGTIALVAGEAFRNIHIPENVKELYEKLWNHNVSDQAMQQAESSGLYHDPLDKDAINWKGAPHPYGKPDMKIPLDPEERMKNWKINEDGSWTQKSGAEIAAEKDGFVKDFSITLGQNGVPVQLERVFHEIALDHMELPAGSAINEEVGAKSLNVAANLVRLANGENVRGVSVETFKGCFEYDPQTGKLEICDHTVFNNMLDVLNRHADELWKAGKMQGAVGELGNIKASTWLGITHASSAEHGFDANGNPIDTGIHGHDEITEKDITDFGKSDEVANARQLHHSKLPNSGAEGANKYKLDDNEIDFADYGNANGPEKYDLAKYAEDTDSLYANAPGADRYDFADYGVTDGSSIPKENPADVLRAGKIDEPKGTGELKPTPPKPEEIYSTPDEPNAVEEPKTPIVETPTTLSPKAQTNDVLEKIFNIDDIGKSQDWAEASKQPAQDMLDISASKIKDGTVGNAVIEKIWAYTNYMEYKTGLKPITNENLGDYLNRIGKEFLNKFPKNNLEEAYKSSELFLQETKK